MKTIPGLMLTLLTGLCLLLTNLQTTATEHEIASTTNKTGGGYVVGDIVADFRLKNIDGRMVSLKDYESAKGFVIIFVSNHCPFSKSYEDRINNIDRKYASQGYPVIAINPNDPDAYEEDSFSNMQARAREKGYTYPYLTDNTQSVTRLFGATRTPQAFVLKKQNNLFIVQYIGAIDDNSQDPALVNRHYVSDAVNNLLLGKPVVTTTTKAIGCAIKWKL